MFEHQYRAHNAHKLLVTTTACLHPDCGSTTVSPQRLDLEVQNDVLAYTLHLIIECDNDLRHRSRWQQVIAADGAGAGQQNLQSQFWML